MSDSKIDRRTLSRKRADELISIGTGKTSVDAYRLKKRDNQRLLRLANRDRNPAKDRFLELIAASNEKIARAKKRALSSAFSEQDISDMRDAVSNTIFACQEIFDILRPKTRGRRSSH